MVDALNGVNLRVEGLTVRLEADGVQARLGCALAHLHTTLELPEGMCPSADQLGKALSLCEVVVDVWDPACSHHAAPEPLFRVERCQLSSLLPLLREGTHAPLCASLDLGPVTLRSCTAQLQTLVQLVSDRSRDRAPAQLADEQSIIDRQAACIALLLQEVDELREAKNKACLANTIISASLERHMVAIAILQEENAEMLARLDG